MPGRGGLRDDDDDGGASTRGGDGSGDDAAARGAAMVETFRLTREARVNGTERNVT